jgi:hypothetical protein
MTVDMFHCMPFFLIQPSARMPFLVEVPSLSSSVKAQPCPSQTTYKDPPVRMILFFTFILLKLPRFSQHIISPIADSSVAPIWFLLIVEWSRKPIGCSD